MKKGILKNFSKFTGKHLCHSLIFNKVAGLMSANLLKIRPATLLNKRLQHRCFPVNFVKFLKSTLSTVYVWTTASVLQKTYRRLLVKILGETSVMESFVRKASKPSGTQKKTYFKYKFERLCVFNNFSTCYCERILFSLQGNI